MKHSAAFTELKARGLSGRAALQVLDMLHYFQGNASGQTTVLEHAAGMDRSDAGWFLQTFDID